jgi:Flp pilus assembly protein CpaB
MKLSIVLFLALSALAFAKDKKDEAKPTPDQTAVLDLVKAQRDYANLARQAMPMELELQRREKELADKNAKLQASCGEVTKWKFNPVSCECDEVKQPPVQPEPPKQENK